MPRGGPRPNTANDKKKKRIGLKTQASARIEARRGNHILPHEILLKAAHGESFLQRRLVIVYFGTGPNKGQEKRRDWIEEIYWPTFTEQLDAAKSAAPYYAPRLASQTIDTGKDTTKAFQQVMKELSGKLPG